MFAKGLESNTIRTVITTPGNGRQDKHWKSIMINFWNSYRNKDKKEGKGQYFYSSNERYEGELVFVSQINQQKTNKNSNINFEFI